MAQRMIALKFHPAPGAGAAGMSTPCNFAAFHKPYGTQALDIPREHGTAIGNSAARKCSDKAGHWDIANGRTVRCTMLCNWGSHEKHNGKRGKPQHMKARHTPLHKQKCQCLSNVFRTEEAGIQARKSHHTVGYHTARYTAVCSCCAEAREKLEMMHMMASPNCQAGSCLLRPCLMVLLRAELPPATTTEADLLQQNLPPRRHRREFLSHHRPTS